MTKVVVNQSGKVKRTNRDKAREMVRTGDWSYASKTELRKKTRRG